MCLDHVDIRVATKNRIAVEAAVGHAGIIDHSLIRVVVDVASGEPMLPVLLLRHHIALPTLNSISCWNIPPGLRFFNADIFYTILQNYISQSKTEFKNKNFLHKKIKPWMNSFFPLKLRKEIIFLNW